MPAVAGTIHIYSRKGEVIISGMYYSIAERQMLMKVWKERYRPIAYYFVISPIIFDKAEVGMAQAKREFRRLMKRKNDFSPPKKELPMPTTNPRPKAQYNNINSPYGIADELHR